MSEISKHQSACEQLREAAALIRDDPIRRGSTLHFGSAGQVVMTGDFHGNLRNFDKLQRFCSLPSSPGRCVILHELIHEEPARPGQADLSIDLLLRAAAWKCEFPDSVFFLQSNHELSQLLDYEITKGGRSVLHDFARGVAERFGATHVSAVLAAVSDYIAALPLAARTANGVFMAHSLPDPLRMQFFDHGIFDRLPQEQDLMPGGAAHALVWGRFHSERDVDSWINRVQAQHVLVGHTPQEDGYAIVGRMIILASDHAHGVFLPFDLSRRYSPDELQANIRKFVSVE